LRGDARRLSAGEERDTSRKAGGQTHHHALVCHGRVAHEQQNQPKPTLQNDQRNFSEKPITKMWGFCISALRHVTGK
jgi:hypothetical protein